MNALDTPNQSVPIVYSFYSQEKDHQDLPLKQIVLLIISDN